MPGISGVRTASTIATQGSNTPRSLTTSSAAALLRSLTGQYEGTDTELKKGWSEVPGPTTYRSPSKVPKKQKSFFEVELAGGGAAAKAAEIFKKYDQDGTGDIDPAEMTQALRELGILDGVPAKEAGKVLAAEMKSADLDSDGRIDFREFIMYFERLARWRAQQARAGRLNARQNSAVPPGWDGNPGLRKAFLSFCQLGKKHGVARGHGRETIATSRLTAQQFMQLCRGAGLVEPNGSLSGPAVDVIFATCKSTGARTLTFKGWLESMAIMGDEVNMSFEEVASRFGAKRKLEPVERPETAPGRQQGRASPRLSPRLSPRMSRHLDESESGENDHIAAQYSTYDVEGNRVAASRSHGVKEAQSKVSSAWKPRAPGADSDYSIPSSRFVERPHTAGPQATPGTSTPDKHASRSVTPNNELLSDSSVHQ